MKPPPAPDIRDAHIYGGLTLAAVAGYFTIGLGAVALTGCVLFYLGVWRME